MALLTSFNGFGGVKAMVSTVSSNNEEGKLLVIGGHGVLSIPDGEKPGAFQLRLLVPETARITFAQKDVGRELGEYTGLNQVGILGNDTVYRLPYPIKVERIGGNVWTSWHREHPNRVDCWYLGETGELQLFQIGIITHDDGKTFRLLGEPRWKGQLFRSSTGYAHKPADPKWGALGVSRYPIFGEHGFQWLLSTARLAEWKGRDEEIDPPLAEVPSGNYARVQWYIPFAGQTGQGIAILPDGNSCWVHGADIQEAPDPDGIKRLYHGELVSFKGPPQKWGTKQGAPPKLVGVRRARS